MIVNCKRKKKLKIKNAIFSTYKCMQDIKFLSFVSLDEHELLHNYKHIMIIPTRKMIKLLLQKS